jgi:hypothetical protein
MQLKSGVLFVCVLAVSLLSINAKASDVSKIEDIGNSQYRVTCTSGTERVLTKKDGRWLITSLGGGYVGNYKGHKSDSMSINEVGAYLCNM